MQTGSGTALEARLEWRSPLAAHVDRLVVGPSALQADGRWLAAGDALCRTAVTTVDGTPWCQPSGQAWLELKLGDFRPRVALVAGRFYPRLAFGNLLGSARDLRPVRLLAIDPETSRVRLDPNHPLAASPARVSLRRSPYPAAPGVRLVELFTGPGMQCPPPDPAAAYFPAGAFQRQDESSDAGFYAAPRLTQHLDANCRIAVADFHARLLQPGMRVLDMMSSCESHLPEAPTDLQVSGLGMNAEELAANPRLTARVVQDLNVNPQLPWPDGSFDCVVNTASIEYLIRPFEVIAEVRRVLRPGGVFAVSFSDRWFPAKAIHVWSELHPFERLGLTLSLLSQAGFGELQSETLRGVMRPKDDKHLGARNYSDPLFAAWGRKIDPHAV
ncbi:MAG: methyltransferase domain-containing protein [Betaproteobacteria bacterium]|nr:methyltransferase domain-containing protein [Betaproteobacteria bacterium]